MTLADLVILSGAFVGNSRFFRVDVSRSTDRQYDTDSYTKITTFEIENKPESFNLSHDSITSGLNSFNTFELQPRDFVMVRSDPYYSEKQVVSISGFVYYPGEYIIENPGELITDIIDKAGGLRPEAYPLASTFTRNDNEISISFEKIIRNPRSSLNFSVMNGDNIFIGAKPNLIVIEGAVNSPGNYQYIKNYNLNDYIKMAGGYTKEAAKYSTYITYPNGKSRSINLLNLSPKVLDGSRIVVVFEEETEPFNFTEYATTVTALLADLSQAWLMVAVALR